MRYNRRLDFIVIVATFAVILSFAYNLNSYVKSAFDEGANNSSEIIKNYNAEIIDKLVSQESTENWETIAGEYDILDIEIENDSNFVVTRSTGKFFKDPSVRVRTPFMYKDQIYILNSSVFVFQYYKEGASIIISNLVLIETVLAISFVSLVVFAIYNFTLKYYRRLYEVIEEYEKTGKLRRAELKGYASHIYRRFSSMTENLERQHKNQQHIIASISHDIKTPLTSVMGYAERLSKDNISEERQKRYLDIIYGKSVELQEMVNEFDEYISFNLALEKDKETIDLEYLCRKLKEDFSADLELLDVDFKVNNKAGNVEICVNQKKVKRVFSNIFANCVKHFATDKKKIVVDITCDATKLYVVINDNGTGVSEENMDLIFEPLYTSDEGRKVSGLGLAICREIVNSHGGRIYAEKSYLGGLAICIELDRCDVPKYL